MQEEAAAGRERTCKHKENLTPQSRKCDPPYSANQISEMAKHREVQQIYAQAGPETRLIYGWGMIVESNNSWDNWIIRWCLWHVFRYRDDRNRNRGSHTTRVIATSDVSSSSPSPMQMVQTGMAYTTSPSPTYGYAPQSPTVYAYTPQSPTYPSASSAYYYSRQPDPRQPGTYYDPIRNS